MAILAVPSQLSAVTPHATSLVDVVYINDAANHAYTIPAETKWVTITFNSPVWFRYNAAAAVPGADITDGTGSTYLPSSYSVLVTPGKTLNFVRAAAVATIVSVMRYGT